jgi:alanyl-tRNA synthetase
LRSHERALREIADELRTNPDQAVATVRDREARLKKLQKAEKKGGGISEDALAALGEQVSDIGGTRALVTAIEGDAAKDLRSLTERIRDKFGVEAVVLGGVTDGRVQIVANVQPDAIARGIKAGALAKLAAETVGGGGGGKDNVAQAGGKDASKLPQALDAVREAIAAAAS